MKWDEPRNCKNCEEPFTPWGPQAAKSLFCTYSCRERYYHRQQDARKAAKRRAERDEAHRDAGLDLPDLARQ